MTQIPRPLPPPPRDFPAGAGQQDPGKPLTAANPVSVAAARSQIQSHAVLDRSQLAVAETLQVPEQLQASIDRLQKIIQTGSHSASDWQELNRLLAMPLEVAVQNTDVMKAACKKNPHLTCANAEVFKELKEGKTPRDSGMRAIYLDQVLLNAPQERIKFRKPEGFAIKSLLTIQADIAHIPLSGLSDQQAQEVRVRLLEAALDFLSAYPAATVDDVDHLVAQLHPEFTKAGLSANQAPWITRGDVGRMVQWYVENNLL